MSEAKNVREKAEGRDGKRVCLNTLFENTSGARCSLSRAKAHMAGFSEARRLRLLLTHLEPGVAAEGAAAGIEGSACAASSSPPVPSRTLPRFDTVSMEHYLDDLRSLKIEVYELYRQHPELLPPVEEGMSKGKSPTPADNLFCLMASSFSRARLRNVPRF